jgi:hypothetical protein
MARGKYISLEEARKLGKLDEFAKEHPSKADRAAFEETLQRMAKSLPLRRPASKWDSPLD